MCSMVSAYLNDKFSHILCNIMFFLCVKINSLFALKLSFFLQITLLLHKEDTIFGETTSSHLQMTEARVFSYPKVSSLIV